MAILTISRSWVLLAALGLAACKGDKDGADTDVVDSGGEDADGDGYYAGNGVEDDCDDADADVHPGATEECDAVDNDCDGEIDDGLDLTAWYRDADQDEYGDPESSLDACAQPDGYVEEAGDCDDTDADFNPNASETDCSDPNDYNCDGSVGYTDADGDGYAACQDCDDDAAAVNAGATEVCDEIDNDCDHHVDQDAEDTTTWYIDYDTDGYGSDRYTTTACSQPAGFVDNADDCNDASDDAYPGADEYCDGYDNNCDDVVDEDSAIDASTWYEDLDEDGYGTDVTTVVACDQPDAYASVNTDCDDANAEIYPSATEICDELDNNCDGTVDESTAEDASTWYFDNDGDGYGLADFSVAACEQPEGYSDVSGDCYDDGTDFGASINPGADEMCDTYDNDCDEEIDEDDAVDAQEWYADLDGDNFGSESDAIIACDQPAGYGSDSDDCDDDNSRINPDATEICNDSLDNNCDETAAGCLLDVTEADATFYGEAANTALGSAVARAGDVNGDGVDDLLVGAPYESSVVTDGGAAYLVYGALSGGEASISTADAKFLADGTVSGTSTNDDHLGGAVAGAGDLNDDGYDDLLLGALRVSQTRTTNRGAAYVLFGPITDASLSMESEYDIRYVGYKQFDRAGAGVAGRGDVDGDGEADILVGANGYDYGGNSNTGAIYLINGAFSSSTSDINLSTADASIFGESSLDGIGSRIAMAGDMDGDGNDDILVGVPEYEDGTYGGAVFVVSGPVTGSNVLTDIGVPVLGSASNDNTGAAMSPAGDMNGDGYLDLIAGASGSDVAAEGAGAAYLIYGPITGSTSTDDAGATILGEATGDALGTGVAGNGDHDGDGSGDMLVGSTGEDLGGSGAGAAYLFLGPVADGTVSASTAFAKVYGGDIDDNLGAPVLFAGDLSGSGSDDLLLTAPGNNSGGTDAGAIYVLKMLDL